MKLVNWKTQEKEETKQNRNQRFSFTHTQRKPNPDLKVWLKKNTKLANMGLHLVL
jgi:hypothetical protein